MAAIGAKLTRWIALMLYSAAMIHATMEGFNAPYKNWDMLGYVGTVVAWKEKTTEAIYRETMKTVHDNVSPELYADFMHNELSAEAAAFVEQLPIYRVKPLYTGMTWLVHETTGMALPKATWVISATCFALLSILLAFWKPRYMKLEVWFVLIVALTYAFDWPMISLACLSTPDSIATLLTMSAAYCWFMRKSFKLYCLFSWLAVLARPDALILVSAIAAYCALFAPRDQHMQRFHAFHLIVFCTATYFAVSRIAGNYGLERWFIYAFINKTPYPAEATDHLTLQSYWDTLAPSTVLFLKNYRTMSMLIFTGIASFCYFMRPAEGNRFWFHMMYVVWACVTLRFMMFPAWGDDRYYFCYFLPILFAGGEIICAYAAGLLYLVQDQRSKMRNIPS